MKLPGGKTYQENWTLLMAYWLSMKILLVNIEDRQDKNIIKHKARLSFRSKEFRENNPSPTLGQIKNNDYTKVIKTSITLSSLPNRPKNSWVWRIIQDSLRIIVEDVCF